MRRASWLFCLLITASASAALGQTPPEASAPVEPAPPAAPPAAAEAPPPLPPLAPEWEPLPETGGLAPAAPPAAQPLPAPVAYSPPRRPPVPGPLPEIEAAFDPPRRHGPAGAPLAVGMGPTFAWRRDRGYAYVTEHDRTTELDLFASHDVLAPFPFVAVAAGLDYRRFGGTSWDEVVTLREHLLMADLTARLRLAAASWVSPHARVGFGMARTKVELDDEAGAASVEDHDTSWAACFGGGVTLRTPLRAFETRSGHLSSLSLGITAEAGYTLAPDAELRMSGSEHDGIARAPLDLGSLDRNAPYLRLLGVARF